MQNQSTLSKLDLVEFIERLKGYFAREKPLYIEGDYHLHYKIIREIFTREIPAPPKTEENHEKLLKLSKMGVLRLGEIYELVKVNLYFQKLQSQNFKDHESPALLAMLQKIEIPKEVSDLCAVFDKSGEIRSGVYEELDSIKESLLRIKGDIHARFQRILSSQKIQSYLVDRQIHLINLEETLLVRGGFSTVLKGKVAGRSSGGFFYIAPESVKDLNDKYDATYAKKEEIEYRIAKELSAILQKALPYLKFIEKQFDRIDAYCARALFAKHNDFEFIIPSNKSVISLKKVAHPALKEPKLLDIDFEKKILMITGVNAGGKTMLLKTLLSAVFLAKHIIPFRVDSQNSVIGNFKKIEAIIDDPQNVKNDISTFAGRMVSFSQLFQYDNALIGVDEIELGTDSDEAASLFKVMLENLIKKDMKIIITTHHKRLAALLAGNSDVELLAAMYDLERQKPTFGFLKGTIGKSYAFETAKRYGVPKNIVEEALLVHGEDKEKLNDLIEKSASLELELHAKKEALESELSKIQNIKESLLEQKEVEKERYDKRRFALEKEYQEAITLAKEAAKKSESKEIRTDINNANKILSALKEEEIAPQEDTIDIGDRVKSGKTKGKVVSISSKDATILSDEGYKLRLPLHTITKIGHNQKRVVSKTKLEYQRPQNVGVKLDLHGLRVDEAIEKLDAFISDSLLANFDEVLVFHGIGTGKLSKAVREYLETHPRIKGFEDAPPHMGGYGAKLIKL